LADLSKVSSDKADEVELAIVNLLLPGMIKRVHGGQR
jgi:hypothetical protein